MLDSESSLLGWHLESTSTWVDKHMQTLKELQYSPMPLQSPVCSHFSPTVAPGKRDPSMLEIQGRGLPVSLWTQRFPTFRYEGAHKQTPSTQMAFRVKQGGSNPITTHPPPSWPFCSDVMASKGVEAWVTVMWMANINKNILLSPCDIEDI